MAPKKPAPAPDISITGFDNKETRLLAAAFVSSLGADKYNYALFAHLSGFTEATLKKFWPPLKRKAIEGQPAFGAFLAANARVAAKAEGKKRRAGNVDVDVEAEDEAEAQAEAEVDEDADVTAVDKGNGNGKDKGRKKAAKPRSKKVKIEEVEEEGTKSDDGEET